MKRDQDRLVISRYLKRYKKILNITLHVSFKPCKWWKIKNRLNKRERKKYHKK